MLISKKKAHLKFNQDFIPLATGWPLKLILRIGWLLD